MVEITGLRKSYGAFNVLNGLDMSIKDGDVYGFLGRNGCGKTTTMNILCNIIAKDSGSISFGEAGHKIGYLPETPSLFGYMNAYEYLEYIGSCANYSGNIKTRAAEVLDIVGLTGAANRRVKGYSRGMNQRLGIAAAIYDNPNLLILDEPTSALDPEGRVEVMTIIERLKQIGTTIILCTHILPDVERVATRIGILTNGVIQESGTISEVVSRYQKQNTTILLKVMSLDDTVVSAIRDAGAGMVSIDGKTGLLTIATETPEETSRRVVTALAKCGAGIESMRIEKPTLEQIYLKVVNGNAN